jgi:hypothetical protein
VLEHLAVTPEISRLFLQRAPRSALTAAARAGGMITLRDRALSLARQGITSLDEVDRIASAQCVQIDLAAAEAPIEELPCNRSVAFDPRKSSYPLRCLT